MPFPPVPPLNGNIYSLATPARVHVARHVRNGLIPHAAFETEIAGNTNFVAALRGKELFRGATPLDSIPGSGGALPRRVRWRFAAHTGPLTTGIGVTMLLARQDDVDFHNPQVTLYITDATESTTYGSATMVFGAGTNGVDDYPSEFAAGEFLISGIPPDTDVYGSFADEDGGRLISATVYEAALDPTASGGLVIPSAVAAGSPIYAERRGDLYELATSLWKRGAAVLSNWTVDDQATPKTTSSTTPVNPIDHGTDPTLAEAAAWLLSTEYCGTRARPNTVPCVLAVRAKITAGTGTVSLYDSTGVLRGSVAITNTVEGWSTATFDMPATLDRCVPMVSVDNIAHTMSVYAASLFQYSA